MYQSPSDFKYRSENKKEVVAWGEMATGASPDDHAEIVNWYKAHNTTGYDILSPGPDGQEGNEDDIGNWQ